MITPDATEENTAQGGTSIDTVSPWMVETRYSPVGIGDPVLLRFLSPVTRPSAKDKHSSR